MATDTAKIPVVIGVGQVNDRPTAAEDGLDSLQLMAAAARAADTDAGGGWLTRCDWLAIVPQISFRGLDTAALLPPALGITPRLVQQAALASGDTPVRYLNDAANAIARGEAETCLIVGGEALRTAAQRAAATGGPATGIGGAGSVLFVSELRRRYGLLNPIDIYPLYENATRAAWGQSLAAGQAETGQIWSLMSEVAVAAPGAWMKQARSAAEIVEPTAANRPIAFPYTKLMVANSSVNQGAAVIVTSLRAAQAAGIAADQLVFIGAGAAAHEDEDPLARARWDRLEGMAVALEQALALNHLQPADIDQVELYSCFPCVPKMARRLIDWPAGRPATVHGGLTFGGGPVGNYMTHGIAAMTLALRGTSATGLLFANGGHCTHNHAILLLARQPVTNPFPQNYDFQDAADARRESVPALTDAYEGAVTLETYTVFYDRAGSPSHAVVLSLNAAGARVIARVEGSDVDTLSFLTDGREQPVGAAGQTERRGELLYWRRQN